MLSWDFPGSPVVKMYTFTAWGTGSISGWGAKILHAMWHGQKKKGKFLKGENVPVHLLWRANIKKDALSQVLRA